MWNNSQWEQENQELLKEWYLDKVTGKAPDSAVRKIHCEGCGGIFYTRIHSKTHIHTHIEFNSTNLNCDGKFVNPKDSYLVLRRLNDDLCRAHGLSVIENPKPSKKERKQKEMEAVRHGRSHKEHLRQTIDRVLSDCRDYDDFLARMRAEGYEIKECKMLSFRAPGWDRFTRSNKLGADYTREALRERSTHRGGRSAAAKTLNFLIENGLTDYDELAARAEQAGDRFDEVARRIKQLEGRMAEVAQLKTHIINYSKTQEVYAAYKKSRHKKEFLAEHGDEITKHEAAKKAFDALGGKPIPKVAQLSEQYAALLAEKQEQYAEYKALRQDMIAYRTAKQNVSSCLGPPYRHIIRQTVRRRVRRLEDHPGLKPERVQVGVVVLHQPAGIFHAAINPVGDSVPGVPLSGGICACHGPLLLKNFL